MFKWAAPEFAPEIRAAGGAAETRALRFLYAAQHYLMRFEAPPPCRFDVIAIDGDALGGDLAWLRAAFDAG